MADIIQTLKLQQDPSTNVYPNIKADNIPDLSIETSKIQAGAITATKLHNSSVTTDKIATQAVTSDKIALQAVGTSELANASVDSTKINYEITTLDVIRPVDFAEFVYVLLKMLMTPSHIRMFYYREIEDMRGDFSTIEFYYDDSTTTLTLNVGGRAITINNNSTFSDFMTAYSSYIFIVRVG